MDEATRCDRLLLMREGAVIADTTPSELLETTGATTAEDAFLRIINNDSTGRSRRSAGQVRRSATRLLSRKGDRR